MSTTTTSTTYTATTDPVAETVQPDRSKISPRRNSAVTKITTTVPKTPAQQPPSTTPAVPTPPTSRPSTPSTLTGTLSSPPASPTKPTVKPVAKSKWLNHLSHISIATWIGVGLALGGLVVTIYYGIPILRLAIWTAQNDFREACKSELEAGLQLSAACNMTLAQPAQPPPIMKRTTSDMEDKDISRELAPWVAATCFAFLLAIWSGLAVAPKRSVSTGNTSQNKSAAASLSLEQLMEAIIERSESHPQAIISYLRNYLARETFGAESDFEKIVRGYLEALINLVASRRSSIKISRLFITYKENGEIALQDSEPIATEPTENLLSRSPTTQDAEPPIYKDTEIETDEKSAENTTVPAPDPAALSPITTTTADSNTSAAITSSPSRAESSSKRWKAIPASMTTAIVRSVGLISPQPTFLTRVNNARKSQGPLYAKELLQGLRSALGFVCDATVAMLQWFERMFHTDIFQTSQGLFYVLALTFGGFATPLLSLVPYDGVVILVQLIINLMCYAAAVSLPERKVDYETSDLCVNRLLWFSVYTCMCRIWPIDSLGHNVLTWATGTGLCAWTLAVPCVVHGTDNGRSWEPSSMFFRQSLKFGRCILLVAPLPFVHLAFVVLLQRLDVLY